MRDGFNIEWRCSKITCFLDEKHEILFDEHCLRSYPTKQCFDGWDLVFHRIGPFPKSNVSNPKRHPVNCREQQKKSWESRWNTDTPGHEPRRVLQLVCRPKDGRITVTDFCQQLSIWQQCGGGWSVNRQILVFLQRVAGWWDGLMGRKVWRTTDPSASRMFFMAAVSWGERESTDVQRYRVLLLDPFRFLCA